MSPPRSRLDEVLSAGLAHMRLAPTGMGEGKRDAAAADLEDVDREPKVALTRHDKDQELLNAMEKLLIEAEFPQLPDELWEKIALLMTKGGDAKEVLDKLHCRQRAPGLLLTQGRNLALS